MSDAAIGQSDEESQGHLTGYGSKGYRSYVLIALMVVYTLNFIDRNLMGVLAQPIINSFGLTDAQFGFLAGWPFALFYAIMGLPIAMAADKFNRVHIIVICITLWSIMTAMCGLAAGFLALLVFRVGVAIGEAGCTPPANSIIGDYYPPKSRATALGIYSMGVTIGGVLAYLFAGPIAEMEGATFGAWLDSIGIGGLFSGINWETTEGWRIAFVVIGLPGVLIAAILLFTIKEPPRGYSDPPSANKVEKAGLKETLKELSGKPSFWWMAIGAALVAFVGYGLFTFQIPFLMREHGLGVREASLRFGAPLSALGALGTFLGGYLTEKLTKRLPTAVAWVPAVGLLIAIPMYIGAFYATDLRLVFAFWAVGGLCHYAYLGAQYNIGQGVVSSRSRATAIAILLIIVSIIGNGVGPQFVGIVSDMFTGANLNGSAFPELTKAMCAAKDGLSADQLTVCAKATSTGLKQSISVTVCWFFLASFCFIMSARTLKRDFVADLGAA